MEAVDDKIKQVLFLYLAVCSGWLHIHSKQTLPLTRCDRLIIDQEFPTFSRYRTPADAPPRWRLAEWDVPIEIGGVEIRPGDVLIGDVDGVVCVPQQVSHEVLQRAEKTVETEDDVREAVREGVDPLDVYEEYDEF